MIKPLFTYNWQVRDEWLSWCEELSYEELVKKRHGGMQSFLHTLYHVVYCEHIWVSQLLGREIHVQPMEDVTSLDEVRSFAVSTRLLTEEWFSRQDELCRAILELRGRTFSHEKVMLHIVTHEVHHIGQMSVWAREIGRAPVNCDLLPRDIGI